MKKSGANIGWKRRVVIICAILFLAPSITWTQKSIEKNVYITRKGTHYHLDSCRYLSRSKMQILREEAKKYYLPCKVCKPDSLR